VVIAVDYETYAAAALSASRGVTVALRAFPRQFVAERNCSAPIATGSAGPPSMCRSDLPLPLPDPEPALLFRVAKLPPVWRVLWGSSVIVMPVANESDVGRIPPAAPRRYQELHRHRGWPATPKAEAPATARLRGRRLASDRGRRPVNGTSDRGRPCVLIILDPNPLDLRPCIVGSAGAAECRARASCLPGVLGVSAGAQTALASFREAQP
jgi:hypothetical protein